MDTRGRSQQSNKEKKVGKIFVFRKVIFSCCFWLTKFSQVEKTKLDKIQSNNFEICEPSLYRAYLNCFQVVWQELPTIYIYMAIYKYKYGYEYI